MAAILSDEHQEFYEEVGRRIRDARTRRTPTITQEGLAKSVGLTRTSITNVEQGRQKCLLHTLFDIAIALQVDPASLIPASMEELTELKESLANRAKPEKDWILSAVSAAQIGRTKHGA